MHKFARCLLTEWRRLGLANDGETVIVAISGGADSVSLLLGLGELRTRGKIGHRIVAAHFNHGLRDGESDADEQFVRELAVKLGVELAIGRAEKSLATGNLEQNARDARYAFLTQITENLDAFAILTGHTINDHAETFLLNLVRGSGVAGLSGMRPIRSFEFRVSSSETKEFSKLETRKSKLKLIRPLLTWAKRIDTEGYCRDSGVEYRYDTMNEDTAFRRVRIRKILLPLLEDMNPKIVEVLANTASLMQRFCDEPRAEDKLAEAGDVVISDVKLLPETEIRDTVRAWLVKQRGNSRRLTLKHTEAVVSLILSGKSGRVAEIPGGRVVKSGGRLRYEQNKVDKTETRN